MGKIVPGEEPVLSVGSCSNPIAWGHHRPAPGSDSFCRQKFQSLDGLEVLSDWQVNEPFITPDSLILLDPVCVFGNALTMAWSSRKSTQTLLEEGATGGIWSQSEPSSATQGPGFERVSEL